MMSIRSPKILLYQYFSIILFLTCISASLAQEGWTTLDIPNATRYDDVFFVNENIGWAAGGNTGKVYKTINGGRNWNEKETFPNYLRSIQFMDEHIGLCGSLNGSLYRTTDGGNTWTDVAEDIAPRPLGVCGLAKADDNTIYGVGIWSEPAFVIKSTDKGLNWTYIDMSAYANSLIDAFFFDADHGFVTGSKSEEEGGIVLYTEDGGQTWVEKFVTNGLSDRIWKIQTPDRINFYGSVESFVEEGPTRIVHSADMGQTWETIAVDPDYYYCQTVGFIDSQHGWTGGRSTLFETTDGGTTWSKVALGSTYNRFTKVNETTAYLTGSRIYQFTKDLVTGTPDLDPYDPIHHISVSPNPTNGKANVKVNFGNRTMAHVYLYSTTGKNLKKIFDGELEAGEKIFDLDISGSPSQTMIVILKTNEGMESIKIIKK